MGKAVKYHLLLYIHLFGRIIEYGRFGIWGTCRISLTKLGADVPTEWKFCGDKNDRLLKGSAFYRSY